jgi:ubiquinone/menaquinone biosynthesis C-methylase UbiE
MIREIIAANRKLCDKIEPHLPQVRLDGDLSETHVRSIVKYMNSSPGQVIVDVGAGKSSPYVKYRKPALKTKIIGVDVSEEELKDNVDVDEKRVANIMVDLPFEPEEVDLILSTSVLEHLENVESFIARSRRVLKVGGYFIHVFSSKFAPYALINQALPNSVARKVLYFAVPDSPGIRGFPAFYDRTYYSGISRLLKQHNFEVVSVQVQYYQSPYFKFFFPLFLVSAIYEMLIRALGAKDLAGYVLVIARKA